MALDFVLQLALGLFAAVQILPEPEQLFGGRERERERERDRNWM